MSSCLLPKPCSMARFSQEDGLVHGLTDVVSSLWAKACAPIRERLATEKSARACKQMLAFPTNSSLSPLVWLKNLFAFQLKSHTHSTRKDLPLPTWRSRPPSKGPLSVPVRPWPDPCPTPQRPGHLVKAQEGVTEGGGAEMFEKSDPRGMEGKEGLGEPSIPRPHPTMTQRPKRGWSAYFPTPFMF